MTLRKQLDNLEQRTPWPDDGPNRLPAPVAPVPAKTPADLVELQGLPEPGEIEFMLLARESMEEPAAALAEFVLDRVHHP